ncbi:metallophosphatase [Leeuwenhoekiella marinoflava]|uniref:5'-nucleotidase n=2 Tax=Leeuwenhoekiella marinoflava TaxID=988 RepID=A0A4Q0PSF7_9FLAO|nr:metallophosphatase [Leeuwenhoekiella marinoflava]RXG32865.1 5'-nucleotidase [Leeuwenhoekiella marinoflava]SHE59518.1 5'-nucleotidase [Leeuwenhoekiella marinoflava DSM 3653]
MERRTFIKQTGIASAVVAGTPSFNLFAETKKSKKITILHTNDVHSHIDPFPPEDASFPNQGGVARRLTLIESIRKENPNTLLLDAGDIFQGTPYFNFYGGELEFKLMSMMQYDAATIGNHDFDNGVNGLAAQMPNASFKMLSSNYDFTNTVMEGLTKPYEIFIKDGIKIGVFGLGIQLEGLVTPALSKETQYLDPIEIALDMTRLLKEEQQCDLVICLSHLGYNYKYDKISDLKLAEKTKNIDLIIGGHTHTFLEKPTIIKNAAGLDVIVNQVGWAGINLGRIDFEFDLSGNATATSKTITV